MTDTVIATRSTITIGPLSVDGFMLPDGSYRMSQTQTAEAVGLDEMFNLENGFTCIPRAFKLSWPTGCGRCWWWKIEHGKSFFQNVNDTCQDLKE